MGACSGYETQRRWKRNSNSVGDSVLSGQLVWEPDTQTWGTQLFRDNLAVRLTSAEPGGWSTQLTPLWRSYSSIYSSGNLRIDEYSENKTISDGEFLLKHVVKRKKGPRSVILTPSPCVRFEPALLDVGCDPSTEGCRCPFEVSVLEKGVKAQSGPRSVPLIPSPYTGWKPALLAVASDPSTEGCQVIIVEAKLEVLGTHSRKPALLLVASDFSTEGCQSPITGCTEIENKEIGRGGVVFHQEYAYRLLKLAAHDYCHGAAGKSDLDSFSGLRYATTCLRLATEYVWPSFSCRCPCLESGRPTLGSPTPCLSQFPIPSAVATVSCVQGFAHSPALGCLPEVRDWDKTRRREAFGSGFTNPGLCASLHSLQSHAGTLRRAHYLHPWGPPSSPLGREGASTRGLSTGLKQRLLLSSYNGQAHSSEWTHAIMIVQPCDRTGSGAQRPSKQKKHAPEKSFGKNSQKTKSPVENREESGRVPQQSCRTASCGSSGAVWRQSCDQGVSESCEIRTVVLNHGCLREGPLSRSQELKDSLLGSHRGSGNVIRPIPCGDPLHPPSVAAGGFAWPCCDLVRGS